MKGIFFANGVRERVLKESDGCKEIFDYYAIL